MTSLFERKNFVSNAGIPMDFKIDCDALTDEDIETLADIINRRHTFSQVYSVPTGGDRLAAALQKFCVPNGSVLIVDDVLSTGGSMERKYDEVVALHPDEEIIGVVVFTRGSWPEWVDPIFTMWELP